MALGDLFNKRTQTAAQQLLEWQVLAQLIGAVLAPALQEVQRAVNEVAQTTPLSAAELADMVNRAIVAHGDGEAYAKQSGVAPQDFARLVAAAGNAISPQEAVAALRRGLIGRSGAGADVLSLEQAVRESRIRDKWAGVIEQLGSQPVPPSEAADAAVKGQLPYEDAAGWAAQSGFDGPAFKVLTDTRGNPPSPLELVTLLRKRLIPLEGVGPEALSFQQGIYEGATKDKWWRLYSRLGEYIPPPRTVTAMVREGSLSDDQALSIYQDNGLSPELAAAYLVSAHHQKTQAQRELTVSQVGALYKDGLMSQADAEAALGALHYTPLDIPLMIGLWDFEAFQTRVRNAIARIHNLYVQHKIDAGQASNALDSLQVPASGRDQMLATWNLEREVSVPQLTRAEILDAWHWGVIDTPETDRLLEALGWSAEEAAILRGIRDHKKQ